MAFLKGVARYGSISGMAAVLLVIGAIMMFWVWNDIAKNGIRTARMMVPGVFACGGLGIFLFIGLVQWRLAQKHERDDLWNWGLLWIAVGVVHKIYSFAAGFAVSRIYS